MFLNFFSAGCHIALRGVLVLRESSLYSPLIIYNKNKNILNEVKGHHALEKYWNYC